MGQVAVGATMTDHTPDVADLPAELEQLRKLAGYVARFASERAELWRVRRALETGSSPLKWVRLRW